MKLGNCDLLDMVHWYLGDTPFETMPMVKLDGVGGFLFSQFPSTGNSFTFQDHSESFFLDAYVFDVVAAAVSERLWW